MNELEKEPKTLSKKQLIKYYVNLLKKAKKDNHRKYINHMIGFHSGLLPPPDKEITSRLR
jgi:hypothetical protein|tara:strand:+ start:962 stop:1141 length:180 start_codon:yes stop_codon:yes gene_type:complete